ncbi:helix-turn-helix transcriptional regulator [Kordiimonas sp. SCSIO 12610]|uniref:helix-turn-helix transcriptional regulator n=1 Tax=Kordiimonas sp. SCSIO 12610 TaxID=2829597 RepID=UPI00210E14BA|nr:helix-turn-helix domain-containing protein [Kordiimonas sp. SCSIO 12610]UTW54819.1 helix-turn-helix domain-containing protein [Kordiimonas sp. SCSIO 12610]
MTKRPNYSVQKALVQLGANIRLARIERRYTVEDIAKRMRVSSQTVMNIEKGKPGVSIGSVAHILAILQALDQLSDILDVSTRDPIGDLLRKERLPKRVRKKKRLQSSLDEPQRILIESDGDGLLF